MQIRDVMLKKRSQTRSWSSVSARVKSRQYVTAIANERRRASVATYARFAEALDVPLAALFDGYPLDLLSTEE